MLQFQWNIKNDKHQMKIFSPDCIWTQTLSSHSEVGHYSFWSNTLFSISMFKSKEILFQIFKFMLLKLKWKKTLTKILTFLMLEVPVKYLCSKQFHVIKILIIHDYCCYSPKKWWCITFPNSQAIKRVGRNTIRKKW